MSLATDSARNSGVSVVSGQIPPAPLFNGRFRGISRSKALERDSKYRAFFLTLAITNNADVDPAGNVRPGRNTGSAVRTAYSGGKRL